MSDDRGETGFGDWPLARLLDQKRHLGSILTVSAGQADHAELRAEYGDLCAEINRRRESSPEVTCGGA
jgi:hypothetical protein